MKLPFLPLIALAAALAFSPVLSASDAVSGPAPSWQLQDVDGKAVQSSQFAGKVVLVDFWATWCPPCRKGIPDLIALQKEHGDKGLAVVGISLDRDGPAGVKEFMKKMGVTYPIVMGDEKVVEAFGGIDGIPTAFLIDRKGNLVMKHVGLASKEDLEKAIKPLL